MRRTFLFVLLAFTTGCRAVVPQPGLPTRNTIVRDQLIVYSDFSLPERHRLLEDLLAQRGTLAAKLALPVSDEPIHVYLFATADEFRTFARAHYPEYPDRRAFFVETDTRLAVYAAWGDHLAEDLRHEVAHGYLHAIVPGLPLWLDEGLAEYFEVPRGHRGFNVAHLPELSTAVADGQRPDLRRLESLAAANEMQQADYAEAWAWVYFLLETTPERQELLRAYLQSLRRDEPREPLSARLRTLHLDYDRQLADFVRQLGPPAGATAGSSGSAVSR